MGQRERAAVSLCSKGPSSPARGTASIITPTKKNSSLWSPAPSSIGLSRKRTLGSDDSVFMPTGVMRATFNVSIEDARVIAILGPCVGEIGAEQVDVSDEAPWNGLRATAT